MEWYSINTYSICDTWWIRYSSIIIYLYNVAWCLDIKISLIAIACLKLTDIVNIDIVYNFFDH